jgi:hypothetical protein
MAFPFFGWEIAFAFAPRQRGHVAKSSLTGCGADPLRSSRNCRGFIVHHRDNQDRDFQLLMLKRKSVNHVY